MASLLDMPQAPKLIYRQENSMIEHSSHYINGRWQPSIGTERMDVVNAATEDVMATIPLGNADDANAAVAAARAATGRAWLLGRRRNR